MTDEELIKWLAQGHAGVPQKPVDWYRDGYPQRVIIGGHVSLKYYGLAHDLFTKLWSLPSERRRLEKLGFKQTRPEGRYHVTFTQPIDSEALAYFPPPEPHDEDDERQSTQEAVWAFVKLDQEYEVPEIVAALVPKGYEPSVIVQKIEKLVNENSFTRLSNGRIINRSPF